MRRLAFGAGAAAAAGLGPPAVVQPGEEHTRAGRERRGVAALESNVDLSASMSTYPIARLLLLFLPRSPGRGGRRRTPFVSAAEQRVPVPVMSPCAFCVKRTV